MPEIVPLYGCAAEKAPELTLLRDNQLRVALTLSNYGSEKARHYAERLAALIDPAEIEKGKLDRARVLLELSREAGHPEAAYLISGVYDPDNATVKQVLERAN